ncbi:MAG TPA: primosomal protein N' [Thermoanaerobaculia bacterium]|nr:primosomal protein N' [Thermoanaerobaculia bacterium]
MTGERPAGAVDEAVAESVAAPSVVGVAVPVPIRQTLSYRIPEHLRGRLAPGQRVRVRIGKRRLVGVALELAHEGPEGVSLREIDALLDREPVLGEDLLELARFTADYYLAPIGEVLRTLLPADLPPWGERKVWLTDAGALSSPRGDAEAAVVEALRDGGRLTLGELDRRLSSQLLPAGHDLTDTVDRLIADGRLASGESRRSSGVRYVTAVELAAGDVESHLEAAGRSKPGRAVVELLAALGRPATLEEVTETVDCGAGVVRRLVKLGALRRFTQIERLSLDRHRMQPAERPSFELRGDQQVALDTLAEALDRGGYAPHLLTGMTGSGKTEVYMRLAERVLAAGRTAVILVPEIALVPALAREVEARFAGRSAILHSNLASQERHQEWERIRRGEAKLVLGPRSALFAPVADLGLVVVDEEQDTAYKQDLTPRYHARDLALVRAQRAGAVALLVSATPSLESRFNVERERLAPLQLTARAGQGKLPEGILVDLREEAGSRRPGEIHFSERLLHEIERALQSDEQVILLRNRRGYSPMMLCRACGEDFRCEQCGLPRTYHRRDRVLLCHYCGSRLPAPRRCPSCEEEALEAIGAGTERVEERFTELFPEVPVAVLDRDAVRRTGGVAAVLERFASGDARVLIGTQMVSKGHHFPDVGLAAVLAADTYLSFPDFRAVERTYNLLVQLAGRAGRGDRAGRVVIQTYHPEHYAIQAAMNHDDTAFAQEEMRFRRVFHYPPYTRMVQLLVRDRERGKAEEAMRGLAKAILAHPRAHEARITGPAPAPFERLRDRWRFQLLIRSASLKALQELVADTVPENPPYELVVDVDPQQLL